MEAALQTQTSTKGEGEDMATFTSVRLRATRDDQQRALDVDVEVSLVTKAAKMDIKRVVSKEYSDGSLVCELVLAHDAHPENTNTLLATHESFAGAFACRYVVLTYESDVVSVVAVED
jgi:hypothetical protein